MDRREFGKVAAATIAGFIASPARAVRPEHVSRSHRKEWARAHFRGFENILIPSFTSDLSALDERGIRLDVRQSIAHGFFSTLLTPAGLSVAEMKRFLDIAVDEAAGHITIAFAVHREMARADKLEIVRHGEEAGAQAFLLDLPTQGSEEDLADEVAAFAEASNLGLTLWHSHDHHFERFGPSAIPYRLFDKLADIPNVVGLKVASMDAALLFELFERYNKKILVNALVPSLFPLLIKAYGLQWSGAWTVEALQSPERRYAVDFFNLALAGRWNEAMPLYWNHVGPGFNAMGQRIGPLARTGGHPWEHFKYYQFCTGGNGGRIRKDPEHPDLPPVSSEDMAYIRASFEKIGVPIAIAPDTLFDTGRAART